MSIEKRPNNHLRDTAGLLVMGLLLFGGLYLLLGGGWTRADASPNSTPPGAGSPAATGGILPQEILVLRPGEAKTIGKTRIVYRGIEEARGAMRLDVSLLELDPQVAYRHLIGIRGAQEQFSLAGLKFRLLSARPDYLQLRLVRGSPGG